MLPMIAQKAAASLGGFAANDSTIQSADHAAIQPPEHSSASRVRRITSISTASGNSNNTDHASKAPSAAASRSLCQSNQTIRSLSRKRSPMRLAVTIMAIAAVAKSRSRMLNDAIFRLASPAASQQLSRRAVEIRITSHGALIDTIKIGSSATAPGRFLVNSPRQATAAVTYKAAAARIVWQARHGHLPPPNANQAPHSPICA